LQVWTIAAAAAAAAAAVASSWWWGMTWLVWNGVVVDGHDGVQFLHPFSLLPGPLCWHSPLLQLCVLPL